jgi:hypothetical protein
MQTCSKCKEFECSCSPNERVRIGHVMGVVLTVPYCCVFVTHIDFFCCGFLLVFLHVLYVCHKLNLLMLSSRLS